MLSLIDSVESLIVKVLAKSISLYVIRDILEVNKAKNPLSLDMGVSVEGYEVISLQTHNRYKMEQMPITGYKKLYIFEKGQWKFRGYIQSSEIFNEWMVWDKGNGYECVDFDELNIDIKNDTTALLRLKNSNKPWVIYQINKDGMYYSFDNRLERIYTIGNDKLSEYDIKIIK